MFLPSIKNSLAIVLAFAICSQADSKRVCKDVPDGITIYDHNWSFADFHIPKNSKVKSSYGGFTRPSYPPAAGDYNVQFDSTTTGIHSLYEKRVFNFDNYDTTLYNKEFNLSNFNLIGPGYVRISLPTAVNASWNQACVTYDTIPNITVTCKSTPDGITYYDANWTFVDFDLGEGQALLGVYNEFLRPAYSDHDGDFIVQKRTVQQSFSSLFQDTLFNFDEIDTSLYFKWTSLTAKNVMGHKVIRVSAPTGAGLSWGKVCIQTSGVSAASIIGNLKYRASNVGNKDLKNLNYLGQNKSMLMDGKKINIKK